MRILKFILLTVTLYGISEAAILTINPYAQWTFDTPIQQVIYQNNGTGFPIRLILTKDLITLYDSTGNKIREIDFDPEAEFIANDNSSSFMLVEEHPSAQIDRQERVYSFQVYAFDGSPIYTSVCGLDLLGGKLDYQLTDRNSILLTERGKSWIKEISGEDTLLAINSCKLDGESSDSVFAVAAKLKYDNELVSAVSPFELGNGDSSRIELRLWNHDECLTDHHQITGMLAGIKPLSPTDYYFLEIDHGAETSLTLFNRADSLASYPWRSWDISLLDEQTAFVITERDLNVVNLGDGTLAASYHPIDLSSISDAAYIKKWGLFLFIRYESFFAENGQQAYRRFVLEGVNKAGRIVYRSSFGTWSYSLPKINRVGLDMFAVHIYNAILLYRIGLDH